MKRRIDPLNAAIAALSAAAVAGVSCACAYGVFVASNASATVGNNDAPPAAAGAPTPSEEPKLKYDTGRQLALRDFPRNVAGQTYGSDANADRLEEAPQLVGVIGDHGEAGYVLREDLWGPQPQTLEEAAQLSRSGPQVLKVYDQEGRPIDETFTLVVGDSHGAADQAGGEK